MRHLEDTNHFNTVAIVYVPMRGKYDCMTCVTAMLLGIKYEKVEEAFGGNIDPFKDRTEESNRLYGGFRQLLEQYRFGILELLTMPAIREGRRYWVGVHIDDPANSLSQIMGHSIVIDEAGRVFDPNPQYGQFKTLAEWRAAMTLPHQLEHATEVFEYLP